MSKQYVIEGAVCMCKFGTTPGFLKIIDQKFAYINGSKLVATTMNLGNVFQPPAFTVCNIVPSAPKSCTPVITQWNGAFSKIKINQVSEILTNQSKGTCSLGCPNCIEFTTSGQIALPGTPQMKEASKEFQGDLDPTGESLALNEHQIDCFSKIIIS